MRDMKVLPDDFEEAFIGFKCLDIAMRNLKSDRDTAIIWFEKNIDETLMGDYDPLILFPMSYIQYLGYFTQVHRIEREDE